jgi:hypothetical protein
MTADEALFDTVLPGDGTFPPASATSLAARVAKHDRFAATLAPILARLPQGFGDLPATARIDMMRAVELMDPPAFAAMLTTAYSLYYTHPLVAAAIELTTGLKARPPQPEGYSLKPFDPAMVAVPAAKGRLYRTIPEDM